MKQEQPDSIDDPQAIVEELADGVTKRHGKWNEECAWFLLRERFPQAPDEQLQWFADHIELAMAKKRTPAQKLAAATNTFHEQIAVRRDLEFLRQPDKWPYQGTLMCLRHRTEIEAGGIPKVGVIWAKHPLTVLQINQYDLPMFGGSMTMEEAFATRIDYSSHEELLKDWKID